MLLSIVLGILILGIVVFVHELGHFLVAKRNRITVDEFGFGFPPRLIKLAERNGTIYSINAIPFGGFVRMRGEDDPTDPGSFAAAPRGARAATLFAGAGMNFLLAILLFTTVALLAGMPDTSVPGAVVTGIAPASPAEQAGLRAGDRIIGADGAPLATVEDLQKSIQGSLGRAVTYQIARKGSAGEETLSVTMTPRTTPPAGQGALGIQISPPLRPTAVHEALWAGVRSTATVIGATFAVPAMLIRQGRPIGDAGFMGPVGITVISGEMVRTAADVSSVIPVLNFMALLSAAVGITQLLPIPALDGGRLLFILIETLRGGRRISPAQEGMVHLIGFGLLLMLIGVLTIREISSLAAGTFPSIR